MSQEVATTEKLDLSVLTAEQSALLDKLKLYGKAEDHNRLEKKFLAYYRGRAANALKEITDHKLFTPLLVQTFPEKTVRWLQFCMNFASAVDVGKNAPVRLLPDSRLLKGETLSKSEEEKIGEAVLKVTGDKGIKTVIKDYKKKIAREKLKDAPPVDAVQREKQLQADVEESGKSAIAKLEWALHWKDAEFVMMTPATEKALAAICVRFGKRVKGLKKLRKIATAKNKNV